MSDIRIYRITGETADQAAGVLLPELAEELKASLPVTALGAVEDGELIGALGGMVKHGVFELSSIYVRPDERLRGVGRALLEKLEDLLRDAVPEIGVSYTLETKERSALAPFLEAMDFLPQKPAFPAWYLQKVGELEEERLPAGKQGCRICSFARMQERDLKALSNRVVESGVPLPKGGLLSERLDPHASFLALSEEKILSFIALERAEGEMLKTAALWSALPDTREWVKLLGMVESMLREVKKRYAPETQLGVLIMNPPSEKLMKYLMKHVRCASFRYYKMVY